MFLFNSFSLKKVCFGVSINEHDADGIIAAIIDYFKAWEFFLLKDDLTARLIYPIESQLHAKSVTNLNKQISLFMDKYLIDYEATPFLNALKHSDMSQAEMQQNILEMILAGTDTSSVSLYYTILLLAENRSKSERLLSSLLSDPKSTYTDYVLKEAMRLLPVGPVIIRQAVEDCVLSGGLKIKRGTNFVLHLARMNRDRCYFVSPLEFEPERFADRVQTELFFPMGKGPKSCIGQYFAMVEMRQILVEFVKTYHVMRSSNSQCIHMRTKWDIAQQPILEERVLLLPKKHCFLVGANSVGKSTLATHLGNLLGCQVSTEKAREVLKEMNVTGMHIRSDPATCLKFQKEIIKRLAASS